MFTIAQANKIFGTKHDVLTAQQRKDLYDAAVQSRTEAIKDVDLLLVLLRTEAGLSASDP